MLLLASLFVGCRNDQQKSQSDKESIEGSEGIPVIVRSVQSSTQSSETLVSGNVEGNKTVRLAFMVGGRISNIISEDGQVVSKGQLVASLDPALYNIAKQQADIQVGQVSDEYNRLSILHERNSLSESDFKKVSYTLQQAKTQQRLHAQNLAYTKLYSPITGVVLKTMAETGEITSVGNPVLVISDISSVNINAYIPENQLSSVRIGQQASVDITALGRTTTGKVIEVGSAAEATSRAFTVKIKVANPGMEIRPGMIAEVKFKDSTEKQGIMIPTEALLKDAGGESFVYTVDLSLKKAFKRRVSIGALSANEIQIVSGLKEGESIVTGGQHKLSDGVAVSISK